MAVDAHPQHLVFTWQFWFVSTLIVVASVQYSITHTYGDAAVLLHVGAEYPASDFIQRELGAIPIFPSVGHDGQASYVVARQPAGGDAAFLLDDPVFRYRRWLFPALGGLFGTLGPRQTVLGLAALAAVGMAMSAASTVLLAQRKGGSSFWPVVAIVANPGLWWSVTLTTADSFGVGLALAALASYSRGRLALAVGLTAAAVATKEQFLVLALALALAEHRAGHRRRSMVFLGPPMVVLLILTAVFSIRFGYLGIVGANLSFPFHGLIAAFTSWLDFSPINSALAVFTLMTLVASGFLARRTHWRVLRNLLIGWVLLGIASGEVIWVLGNNASRVFAMVPPLVALAAASAKQEPTAPPRPLL